MENNSNLDIFVCTYKDFEPVAHHPCYKVINANDINGDVAENGLKGSFYSEILTYLYVWKNYKLKDYVGFCHYRKYFAFMDEIPDMDEVFQKKDMITANPMTFGCSVEKQYELCHNIDDLHIVGQLIKKSPKYKEYYEYYQKFITGQMMFPCNMFIMRKEDFVSYCNFIEDILNGYLNEVGLDIEGRIEENKEKYLKDFSPNDRVDYQYRIGGYLAERLTNIFIMKNAKTVLTFPIKQTETKYSLERQSRK